MGTPHVATNREALAIALMFSSGVAMLLALLITLWLDANRAEKKCRALGGFPEREDAYTTRCHMPDRTEHHRSRELE